MVGGFLVQQLSLQHLNVDVRHNSNALKELNDCIGGLLHLGPNVITFRTLFHLGQLLHLGLQQTRQSFRASFGLIMHVTAFFFCLVEMNTVRDKTTGTL